jgi:putative ABC transport system permease protein
MRDVPEVEFAALDHMGPFSAALLGEARPAETPDAEPQQTRMRPVSPEWFELFRVATLHGRTFVDSDWRPSASQGVVLTASLARRLYGRTDVAGRQVIAGPRGSPEEHVVLGVVDDLRSPTNPSQNIEQFFVTYDHLGDPDQWSVMVRVRDFGPDLARRLEDAAATVLPLEQYIHEPWPLSGVDEIRVQEVLVGRLLWILCAFAVLLSGVGLFSSVAFVVSRRNRELGIRMALGADRAAILGLVLRSTLFVVLSGAGLGLAGAFALGRVIQSRLFEVTPLDMPSYLTAATILVAVTVTACLLPARTALRTDPAATLREE